MNDEGTAGQQDELRILREALERTRSDLAAQGAQLQSLCRGQDRRAGRRAGGTPRRLGAATLLAFFMVSVPLTLMAAPPFTDLIPGSIHNADIEAIYAAGITTGCVPNRQYCPEDPVTRQQMASFLARVAGLGGNKPIANAANAQTLQGYGPSGLVRTSQGTEFPPGGVTLTAEYQAIGVVNITAPGGGFILVSGVATFKNETVDMPERVDLRLRDVTASTEQGREVASVYSSATVNGATSTQPWFASLAAAGTFGVPADKAGTQRSFVVEVKKQQTQNGAAIRYINVTTQALFVPFGSNGGVELAVK